MRELIDDIQPTQYNGFCQNCVEKDLCIKKLEEQIEKFKQGEIIPISVAKQSFKMRDKELEIYKKALELACDYTESEWGNEYDPDYFLQQAKEEIDETK